ncbi:PREDICTED: uncharacterized protein LOC106314147 [Brassica oleracea var. oleracea]|nr:PREDICTED: uncharacterized protein LOC106314147 [Brassica oleracea var. oleracea]
MSAISTYLYGKIPETEEMAKKEKSRAKFSQKTLIHIIPFALSYGDLGMREESIAARIEGLMIEGDINNDSDGTQTGFSGATLKLGGDSDKLDHVARSTRASRKLIKGFH